MKCTVPPTGWECTREAGHDGPCAAIPELDGMVAITRGVAEQRFPHTIDARVWVEKWKETIAEHPNVPNDEGTMLGWFASAIMAGYDTARQRTIPPFVEPKILPLEHCKGCEDDFYNHQGNKSGCWMRKSATLIPRQEVGINDMPVEVKTGQWGHKTPSKLTASCYHRKGSVFYNKEVK